MGNEYEILTNKVPKMELKIGESVECVFVGLRPAKFGQLPIFNKDGKEFFIGGKIVYDSVKDLEAGSKMKITFNGMKKSKSGNNYFDYTVGVKRN